MVMRSNTAWGATIDEAQIADDDSYFYTNAAFQHMNLNRDEWVGLEEDVERKFSDDANDKLCILLVLFMVIWIVITIESGMIP